MGTYIVKRGHSIRTQSGVRHSGESVEVSDNDAKVLLAKDYLEPPGKRMKKTIPFGVVVRVETWCGVETCS